AQVAQRTEVQIEIRVGREQRSQTRDGIRCRKLKSGIARAMPIVLLEAAKEKGAVLADRPAHGESKNIVGQNRFRGAVQFVEIGNRVKPLRLIAPQQCPMQTVGARFCNYIEDASAGPLELDAEIAGLH